MAIRFSLLAGALLLWLSFPLANFALCVVEENTHLREGPGTKFPVSFEVIRYTPLKKVKKKDGWYEVKDVDGQAHWIREDLVTTNFKCVTIKDEFANLRKGPGIKYPLAPGKRGDKYLSFRLLSERGEWAKVEDIEGDEAWVLKKLIWVQ